MRRIFYVFALKGIRGEVLVHALEEKQYLFLLLVPAPHVNIWQAVHCMRCMYQMIWLHLLFESA